MTRPPFQPAAPLEPTDRRMPISADPAVPLFVALAPEAPLSDRLWSHKEQTRRLVGEQLYLDHPPHLTVYLALFRDPSAVVEKVEALASRLTVANVNVSGWRVFYGDSLTGGNSLVYELAEEDKEKLRRLQSAIVQALAPLRDEAATRDRYQKAWPTFSDRRRDAVANFGFPYLGPDWEPHFTVASIQPGDWEIAWPSLRNDPPRGAFRCAKLQLFRLEDEHPARITEFPLSA